jgi:hypothetical protein
MTAVRIACLHAAQSNIALFETARRDAGRDDVRLRHVVRTDLLVAAERAGGLTTDVVERTADVIREISRGADAVLVTCSTLGPVVDDLTGTLEVPVLRADAALVQATALPDGRAVALCAAPTTLAPTRALFERAARAAAASVEVRLIGGAWDAYRLGDLDRYLALIAEVADEAFSLGADRVALAQVSMAPAATLCRLGAPLTSPSLGLSAAMAAARERLA